MLVHGSRAESAHVRRDRRSVRTGGRQGKSFQRQDAAGRGPDRCGERPDGGFAPAKDRKRPFVSSERQNPACARRVLRSGVAPGHRAVGIRGRGEIPVPGRNGDERAGPCFDCRNLCPRGRRSGRCGGTADGSDLHRRGGILRRTVPAYLLPGGFRSGPRGPSVRPDTEKLQVRFPDQKGNRPGVERSRSGRREQGDEHRRGDRAVGGLYDRDAFRGRQLYRLVVP